MQLTNEYEVAASIDALWELLNDVERIAPFVPGFTLEEAQGDTYRGTIKVKVGAVTVSYNAEIEVLERDAEQRRVIMDVSGRERRGPGSMHAVVTSQLSATPSGSRIALDTDVEVTGRVAQFGSGVLGDVSATLLARFVEGLEDHLAEGVTTPAPAAPSPGTAAPITNGAATAPRAAPSPTPRSDVVDIGAVAGKAVLHRVALPALAGGFGFLIAAVCFILGRKTA